jgi:hypothetical protein
MNPTVKRSVWKNGALCSVWLDVKCFSSLNIFNEIIFLEK